MHTGVLVCVCGWGQAKGETLTVVVCLCIFIWNAIVQIYYGPISIRVVDFIDYTIISLLLQALPITYTNGVDSQWFDNDTPGL